MVATQQKRKIKIFYLIALEKHLRLRDNGSINEILK